MTTDVKPACSRVEFPGTHVECTLDLARSITRVSLSKNLTVTSLCRLAEDPDANASVQLFHAMVSVCSTWNIFLQSCERDTPLQVRSSNILFALLVRHSQTGNPSPRSTSLINRILVGRRDDDVKQPRSQTAWFLGLIAGSDEVIALHPDVVQRHHGEWRVSPLVDPESTLRELKNALALMTEVDWRTFGCNTFQDIRYHRSWHSAKYRERVLLLTVPDTMWTHVNETTPGHWCR